MTFPNVIDHPPSPARPAAARLAWPAWAMAALFGVVAFALFTRHHDFPFYYHTDEPGKVKQVQTGERNFHHPLLLLKSTEAVLAWSRLARTSQAVVEAGRTSSAIYAALAVAAFTVLAWSLGGRWAGLLAGALLTTHPVLFELAHYMKEDCSLLAGVAATFLAMSLYAQRPTLLGAAAAGAAAGLAASGKLIGVGVATVALLVIAFTPRNGRRWDWRALLLFLGAALLLFVLINEDALRQWSGTQGGLANEMARIEKRTAEREAGFQIKYVSKFARVISVPLLLGALYWAARRWTARREQSAATWALVGFPVLFAAMLSVSPVTKERYLLPVFALFCVLGALGIAELWATAPFRRARPLAAFLALGALGWHLPTLWSYAREFATDDRRELVAWIRHHLPEEATVAHDKRAKLDYGQREGLPVDQFPQRALGAKRRLPDLGSLDRLRARGVHYFVACEADYFNVLRPELLEEPGLQDDREFYERLFREGKLLWERPVGRILYLHPGLRLYELP